MSEKPSKPRAVRASVVKKISDPLQDTGSAKPKSSADEPSTDAKPQADQKAQAESETTKDTPSQGASPTSRSSKRAAEDSVLGEVKQVRAKAVKVVVATPADETPPPSPVKTSPGAAKKEPRQSVPTAKPPQAAGAHGLTPLAATPVPSPAPQTPATAPVASPAPAAKPSASATAVSMQELIAPLQTPIEPVEVTAGYNISAFFVAGAVMLLPMVYLGIVGLVFAGSLWWSIAGIEDLTRSPILFLIARLLPTLFGLVFVFFMIKPMLAPPNNAPVQFSLDREHEPALFQFIDHVAAAVGAPAPKRIDVDTNANASASYRRGMASFFAGDDLVLTIGLPLAAAMNIRELTGVIAHEFGHFTQSSGMRLHFMIRYINYWFERVAEERDAWDYRLEYWIDVLPGRLAAVPMLLQFCVFLTRMLLRVLSGIAAFLSGHLSRQMEFDADRHQLRLCGSESFIQCEYELRFLGTAQALAFQDIQQSWSDNRLSDDWPALVVANIDWIRRKPAMATAIRKDVEETETSWLDTHPASKERIALARREANVGTFQVQSPAKVLFRDFTGLCQAVSLDFYKELVEEEVSASNLVPAEQLYQEQVANFEAQETLNRFFQGKVLGRHEIFMPPEAAQPCPEFAAGVRSLRNSREQMLLGLENLSAAVVQFGEADDRVRELTIAVVLFDAGFRADPKMFKLPSFQRHVILNAKGQAEGARTNELARLDQRLQDARNRLLVGLRLLQNSELNSRIENIAESRTRTAQYLAAMSGLESVWPSVLRLREAMNMLGGLFHFFDGSDKDLIKQIERISQVCHSTLAQILQQMNGLAYPFSHAKGRIAVSTFLLKEMPKADEPLEILQASDEAVDKMLTLYYRLFSQLAVAAETVETAIGLPLLPTPKDDDEMSEEERAALGVHTVHM